MAKETVSTASTDIDKIISELKQKEIDLPDWETKLKHEYFPSLHPVMTDPTYRDKPSKNGLIKVTRATRGLQRRAVKIMTGMMFGIPVKRVYEFDEKNERLKKAAEIMEAVFQANRIDAVNVDRGIKYNAACEFATLWYGIKEDNELYGEKSKLKIRCKNFSPMSSRPNDSGENIYPRFDEYGDLIAISIEYSRTEDGKTVQYFDTYTATDHTKYRRGDDGWEIVEEEKIESIDKIPFVWNYRPSPIWEDSNNVNEIEWANSRNGNYLRRNSVPVFAVQDDVKVTFGNETSDEERIILQGSSTGSMEYKTWDQAVESLKYHVDGLEKSFFSDIQIPNFSREEMSGTAESGEAKRYMFVETHIKVLEEQCPWLETFSREVNVMKAFLKAAISAYAKEFDALRVKHIITPFEIANESQTITNISNAVTSGIASVDTGMRRLNWVKDFEEEKKRIDADKMTDFTQPTE
jgi:hypothetical protein